MPASAEDETRDDDVKAIYILFGILLLSCVLAILAATAWWFQPVNLDPSFSVKLTDVGGLDPLHSPVIHPFFDLTVRVDNTDGKLCRTNIAATVFYGNMVLGWGSVRDFCVGMWTSTEMKATMLHADVMLTDRLRGSLASELCAGELEVSVEVRMSGYKTSMQSCRVKPGQGYALCDCKVLESSQFSEIIYGQ